jgi:hypothetical protein
LTIEANETKPFGGGKTSLSARPPNVTVAVQVDANGNPIPPPPSCGAYVVDFEVPAADPPAGYTNSLSATIDAVDMKYVQKQQCKGGQIEVRVYKRTQDAFVLKGTAKAAATWNPDATPPSCSYVDPIGTIGLGSVPSSGSDTVRVVMTATAGIPRATLERKKKPK